MKLNLVLITAILASTSVSIFQYLEIRDLQHRARSDDEAMIIYRQQLSILQEQRTKWQTATKTFASAGFKCLRILDQDAADRIESNFMFNFPRQLESDEKQVSTVDGQFLTEDGVQP